MGLIIEKRQVCKEQDVVMTDVSEQWVLSYHHTQESSYTRQATALCSCPFPFLVHSYSHTTKYAFKIPHPAWGQIPGFWRAWNWFPKSAPLCLCSNKLGIFWLMAPPVSERRSPPWCSSLAGLLGWVCFLFWSQFYCAAVFFGPILAH